MLRYPSAGGDEGEGEEAGGQQPSDGSSSSDAGSKEGGALISAFRTAAAAAAAAAAAGASSASAPGTPPRLKDVCKYFVNNNCLRGSECPKFHPPLALLSQYRTAWVQRRAAERALASHLEGDTHDPLQDKTHKKARARVRDVMVWLCRCSIVPSNTTPHTCS